MSGIVLPSQVLSFSSFVNSIKVEDMRSLSQAIVDTWLSSNILRKMSLRRLFIFNFQLARPCAGVGEVPSRGPGLAQAWEQGHAWNATMLKAFIVAKCIALSYIRWVLLVIMHVKVFFQMSLVQEVKVTTHNVALWSSAFSYLLHHCKVELIKIHTQSRIIEPTFLSYHMLISDCAFIYLGYC